MFPKGLDSMHYARPLLPILIALTAAACARQQPAYYVTDSATGERIATAQQDAPQGERGLFASTGLFTRNTPQSGGYVSYADARPQNKPATNRGLIGGQSNARAYVYQQPMSQTYAPRTYSHPPPPHQVPQAYAQQPVIMSYRQPQQAPQAYRPQPAPQTRPAPQPQPAGYYAESYRWY